MVRFELTLGLGIETVWLIRRGLKDGVYVPGQRNRGHVQGLISG